MTRSFEAVIEADGGAPRLLLRSAERDNSESRAWHLGRYWLDCDTRAHVRLERAGEVSLSLSVPPVGSHALVSNGQDARRTRPSVGSLIPPFFLEAAESPLLKDYQRAGIDWLSGRSGAVLADDMGLGKTVTALTAMRRSMSTGPIGAGLVVCPVSLTQNWQREARRWIPDLATAVVQAAPGAREETWRSALGRFHLLITNYEQLRDLPETVAEYEFPVLILDEAHRIRRTQAEVTRSIRMLQAQRRWALTGTPVERDQRDFAVLLSTVAPNHFGPSDERLDPSLFRSRARPYVLRRTKTDVLSELPPVRDHVEWVELGDKQRAAYVKVQLEAQRAARKRQSVLPHFGRLRRLADFDPDSRRGAKIDRAFERVLDVAAVGEKVVVFSYSLDPLHELMARLEQAVPAVLIEGEQVQRVRQAHVDRFLREDRIVALLASSRVASEGLTLTVANHVIFLNEWWNPSNNAQARDRVVRIGQERDVTVTRLRAVDTVDEALGDILDEKQDLYVDLVAGLENPSTSSPLQRLVCGG